MPAKAKSIQVLHIDNDGLPITLVKGNTIAIKQTLIDGGATWDGSHVAWRYPGKELPEAIRAAIADVLGEGGSLLKTPQSNPPKPASDEPEIMTTVLGPKPDPADEWVKQVNDAARNADAEFADTMNMSPVVHLAVDDPDVQKATNKFVQVASQGKYQSVDDLVKQTAAEAVGVDYAAQAESIRQFINQTHTDKIDDIRPYPSNSSRFSIAFADLPSPELLHFLEDSFEKVEHNGHVVGVGLPANFGKPETPWLKVGLPVTHKIVPAKGIIASIYGETAYVNIPKTNAMFESTQYRLIDLEPWNMRLPGTQVQFMDDLRHKRPVKKNAAVRAALRQWGLITPNSDWEKLELTPAGDGYLDNCWQDVDYAIGDTIRSVVSGITGRVCEIKPNGIINAQTDDGVGFVSDKYSGVLVAKATPIEDFKTYAIETRYGVEQGDDWMKNLPSSAIVKEPAPVLDFTKDVYTCAHCGKVITDDPLLYIDGVGYLCDTCDEARLNTPVAKQEHLNAIPERIKGVKKGGKVYAAEDIHVDGEIIVHRGCVGRVVSQGDGGLNVKFTEHQHIILCLWDMVSPDPLPEAPAVASDSPDLTPDTDNTLSVLDTPETPLKTPSDNSGWHKREITITVFLTDKDHQPIGEPGLETVEADVYGQLALHPKWLGRGFSPTLWTLTHIESKSTVPHRIVKPGYDSLRDLAEQLAAVDIDQWWIDVQNHVEDKAQAGHDAIVAIVKAWEEKLKPQPAAVEPEVVEPITEASEQRSAQ